MASKTGFRLFGGKLMIKLNKELTKITSKDSNENLREVKKMYGVINTKKKSITAIQISAFNVIAK